MNPQSWSWILAASNILLLFLSWQVGNKRRWAWLGYIATNVLWIVYALDTDSYGFLLSAPAFIAIAIRNYLKWSPPRADDPLVPRTLIGVSGCARCSQVAPDRSPRRRS